MPCSRWACVIPGTNVRALTSPFVKRRGWVRAMMLDKNGGCQAGYRLLCREVLQFMCLWYQFYPLPSAQIPLFKRRVAWTLIHRFSFLLIFFFVRSQHTKTISWLWAGVGDSIVIIAGASYREIMKFYHLPRPAQVLPWKVMLVVCYRIRGQFPVCR